MNDLAQAFQQWLFEEGRSSKTIESYVGDVKGFQKYLKEKAVNAWGKWGKPRMPHR